MKPPEDSYEAAMRAADALFAAPPAQPQSPQPKQAWPKESWDTQPDIQPRASEHAFNDAPCSETAPEKSGGRILRVLDEAPPPQYAALEIEHAPKRRGRKPGSKNKPKVPVIASQAALPALRAGEPSVTPPYLDAMVTERSVAGSPAEADMAMADAVPFDGLTAPHPRPAIQQIAALQTPAAPRGNKRFSWGRDRPRPGEEWKRRRLPRVCW